jgi:hypothetical protein
MKISKMIAAAAVCLFSLQIQADDYRVLDLKQNRITHKYPWFEVITDQTHWERFYFEQLLGCNQFYPFLVDGNDPCTADAPLVDFETEQVVVGGPGAKPSSAYSIHVIDVDSSTDEQRITVLEYARCIGLAVITYPIEAVVVPRTDKPISLHVEQGAAVCE